MLHRQCIALGVSYWKHPSPPQISAQNIPTIAYQDFVQAADVGQGVFTNVPPTEQVYAMVPYICWVDLTETKPMVFVKTLSVERLM